ncbi:MAG TPA: hypothetical protein VGS10_08570 [Terracidiphilus sp.]|nr:hypothetical protein [Terracidiphilus sp.]
MMDAVWTDDKARMRQFWLRTLLVIGILWGFLPFVMTPFITRGAKDTTFDIVASVMNSLTILPACALAFWHRRIACIWLSVNAVVLAVALATFIRRTGQADSMMIVEVAGPILFALCLDFAEARRWPAAVEKRPASARQA